MRSPTRWGLLGLVLALAGQAAAQPDDDDERHPQETPPGPSAPAAKLSALAAQARAEREPERRAQLAREIGRLPGSVPVLIDLLRDEPLAAVRSRLLTELAQTREPRAIEALERHAASDPDARVAVGALAKLGALHARRLAALADQRRTQAAAAGKDEDRRLLAAAHERWLSLALGGTLPAFLRQPPEPFSVPTRARSTRVLAFGDFGDGRDAQKRTAAAMRAHHARQPFDLAITLGDNFYPAGVSSPDDPRWRSVWSKLYDPLGIPFYASLGNHDWMSPDSPAAQVLYGVRSRSFRLPATRYAFHAGPVDFFALDTTAFSDAQATWLDGELRRSRAPWKVVYGHHPVFSHGYHGDTRLLVDKLLPVLKQGGVHAYFAGHEHDLQHLRPDGGVHFFIAGGGGVAPRPITPGPRSLYAKSTNGFAVIDADARRLEVSFVGSDGKVLYRHTLRAPAPAQAVR